MRRFRLFKIIFPLFILIFSLGGRNISAPLTIWFLDVGQADSTFISLPNGENLLIDAGNDGDGVKIARFLRKNGVFKIDHFIVTHPHEDHLGGADEILARIKTEKIYTPALYEDDIPNTLCYNNFMTLAVGKNRTVYDIRAGQTVIDTDSFSLSCLSPDGSNRAVLNEYSAVLLLRFGDCNFLFAADCEKSNEREMLGAELPQCDLIKVAHHGSDTSSCAAFLNAVAPRFAVFSLGRDNAFGHPSREVLMRLHSIGSEIYRTDLHGTLQVVCDGERIRIKQHKICVDGDR